MAWMSPSCHHSLCESICMRVGTSVWWLMIGCCVQLYPPKQVYCLQAPQHIILTLAFTFSCLLSSINIHTIHLNSNFEMISASHTRSSHSQLTLRCLICNLTRTSLSWNEKLGFTTPALVSKKGWFKGKTFTRTNTMPHSKNQSTACGMKPQIDTCWHPIADNKSRRRQLEERERRRGKKDKTRRSRDVVVWGLIPLRHTLLLLRERGEIGRRRDKGNDLWRRYTWKRCVNTLIVKNKSANARRYRPYSIGYSIMWEVKLNKKRLTRNMCTTQVAGPRCYDSMIKNDTAAI